MMKNTIYAFLIFITGVFCSCDKSEDYFKDSNTSPEVSYRAEDDTCYTNFSTDSAKLSNSYYDLYYSIDDEENLDLSIDTDLRYEIDSEEGYVRFALDEEGTYSVSLNCTDSWNQNDNAYFKLVIYDNSIPIAALTLTQIDGREWEIDASESYDQDEDEGGEIAIYRYYVNDKEIDKTYHSSINYIFPEDDTYEVGLQVQDNDGSWSEKVTQTINIE